MRMVCSNNSPVLGAFIFRRSKRNRGRILPLCYRAKYGLLYSYNR